MLRQFFPVSLYCLKPVALFAPADAAPSLAKGLYISITSLKPAKPANEGPAIARERH